jgi:hypothetical protein
MDMLDTTTSGRFGQGGFQFFWPNSVQVPAKWRRDAYATFWLHAYALGELHLLHFLDATSRHSVHYALINGLG